jgi:hypothetical protein
MENEQNKNTNPKDEKPWYKKIGPYILIAILGFIFISGLSDNSNNQVKSEPATIPTYQNTTPTTYQPASAINSSNTPTIKPDNNNSLSNNNYYTNVNGNTVHSPAYSNTNSIPAGASARCRDGTYSFSQNRRGTCSHHGGVSEWL